MPRYASPAGTSAPAAAAGPLPTRCATMEASRGPWSPPHPALENPMSDIVIAGALRTAVGKFGGALAKVPAPELGATVIRALLERSGVKPEEISEVIMGQVLTAGSGQNPARQASIRAGLPACGPGDDHQQGMRIGLEGGDAGGPGDPLRRRRHRRRRRPGEHERVAARAARIARRLPDGRRQAGRHDDRRWPVGRLQPVPHGHDGGERRQEIRDIARRSRTSSPSRARTRPKPRRKQAGSRTRSSR